MTLLHSTLSRWAMLIGASCVIFWFSHQPHVPLPEISGADKLAHMGAYGVYAFLVARAVFPPLRGHSTRMKWTVVLLWCLLYAMSDEYHQSFIPGRSSDWRDVAADVVGGLICFAIFTRGHSRHLKRLL